jgi:hypothetical protein
MTTNLTDDNNCIQSGLRADIMRCSMENKNLLAKKGSIYVGTGDTQTIDGQTIYKTECLELGNNGEVLQAINGDLQYGKLTNDNFDSSTNYTFLKKTWDSYKINKDQLSGTFSNLTVDENNFSRTENYSNLIRVSSGASSATTSWGASINLKKDEQGLLSLNCENYVPPLKRISVVFGNVKTADSGIYGATLRFEYIAAQSETFSPNSALKKYVGYFGKVESENGLTWKGWCLPSSFEVSTNSGANGIGLYRSPLYINVYDSGYELDFEIKYYRYDGDQGVTLLHDKPTVDTSKQVF